MSRSARRVRWTICGLLLAAWAILLAGCAGDEANVGEQPLESLPLAGLRLRVVVVGDPELSAALEELRGEWEAQTGSKFAVRELPESRIEEAASMEVDAIVCPSNQLGTLAAGNHVVPFHSRELEQGEGDWEDVFELERTAETNWGSSVVAVPFGSPVLVCYYRADLLAKLGRKPPETWAEYAELGTLLNEREHLGELAPPGHAPWCGTIEPLEVGWAGLVLLARAAPYAKHPDNYSALFDINTMRPLVAGPPFQRALGELVAATKFGPRHPLTYTPPMARRAFWQGECGMALSWPTATAKLEKIYSEQVEPGLAELPGSSVVFNIVEHAWEQRPEDGDPRVTLLGLSGRVGVVSARSEQTDAASQLLLWLAGSQWTRPPGTHSPNATLYRRSQGRSARQWIESVMPPGPAAQYAEVVEKSLSRQQSLFALRIPGRAEYLAALDEAVRAAVQGEKTPEEALEQAADRWRAITRQWGVEKQRQAYLRSLNLEPYAGSQTGGPPFDKLPGRP